MKKFRLLKNRAAKAALVLVLPFCASMTFSNEKTTIQPTAPLFSPTPMSLSFGPQILAHSGFYSATYGWNNEAHVRSAADVNGDGYADLIGLGNSGIFVALGVGNGTFGNANLVLDNYFTGSDHWNSKDYTRVFGDVNGDKRADIIGFGAAQVLVSLGTAAGTFESRYIEASAQFASNEGWLNSKHVREVADVNGDGRVDIVAFGAEQVFVAFGQSDGKFGVAIDANAGFFLESSGWMVDQHVRTLGDVNGDGRADIVGFGNENIFVAYGQTNGTFTSPVNVSGEFCSNLGWNNTLHVRKLADFNGDGKADIIGCGNDQVLVALGQSDGRFGPTFNANATFFTTNGAQWTNTAHVRLFSDLNGDRKADIVGFGTSDVYTALGGQMPANSEDGFRVMVNGVHCLQTGDGGQSADEIVIDVYVDGVKICQWGRRNMNESDRSWFEFFTDGIESVYSQAQQEFWLMPGSVYAHNEVKLEIWEEDEGRENYINKDDYIGTIIISKESSDGNQIKYTFNQEGKYVVMLTKMTRGTIDPTVEGKCQLIPIKVPILSQGSTGACVAFSVVAALTTTYLNETSPDGAAQELFDPLAFYARREDNTVDGGWNIMPALNELVLSGIPFRDDPSKRLYVKEYLKIGSEKTYKYYLSADTVAFVEEGVGGKNRMRLELLKRKPLIVNYDVYPDFMAYAKVQGIYGGNIADAPMKNDIGNTSSHAVCVVGFNNPPLGASEFPTWTLQNSWGSDFGNNGLCTFAEGSCGFDDEMFEIVSWEIR